MALNIPNVPTMGDALLQGSQIGNTLFNQMMQPKIQKAQLQQQQAQLQQQWRQHLENIAIKKQQEQRLGEAATREAELHPWEKVFRENRANNERLKYSPEEQQAKLDLVKAKTEHEQAKTNAAKNKQPALTPEQKSEQRLEEFRRKEDIKNEKKKNEDLFAPTKPIQNQAQKTILAINTVKPLLEDLINLAVPGEFEKKFKPAQAAFSEMLQNLGTEEFQSIFNLPKDQHSVKLVEKMVNRRMFESLDDYRTRLRDLYRRVMHKGQMSNDVLANKTVKFAAGHSAETGSNESEKIYNPATRSWE